MSPMKKSFSNFALNTTVFVHSGSINIWFQVGSFRCDCENGFINVKDTCQDIDECHDKIHDCSIKAACLNFGMICDFLVYFGIIFGWIFHHLGIIVSEFLHPFKVKLRVHRASRIQNKSTKVTLSTKFYKNFSWRNWKFVIEKTLYRRRWVKSDAKLGHETGLLKE